MTFTVILYYLTTKGLKKIKCDDCYDFFLEKDLFGFTSEADNTLRTYNSNKITSLSIIKNRD